MTVPRNRLPALRYQTTVLYRDHFLDLDDAGIGVDFNFRHLNTVGASRPTSPTAAGAVDLKTAETQCYEALIMRISYSLNEEKVMDSATGRMLNADMQFYRLAGLSDVAELVVDMMTGKGYDERGVIGLGEPPVISPVAAISNAVANALGVRVPFLPLTPDRVLNAMEQKAGA